MPFVRKWLKSSSRDCMKSLADDVGVLPRRAKTRLFLFLSTPYTGQIHARDVARTTFHTVSSLGTWVNRAVGGEVACSASPPMVQEKRSLLAAAHHSARHNTGGE